MSKKFPFARLAFMLLGACLAVKGYAQEWQPFIEPDYFAPDFQFFAPAEIDDYGGGPPPKTGFFLTYERLHWNVSRPKDVPPDNLGFPQIGDPGNIQSLNGQFGSFIGDWTWGNRWDFGYMTSDDEGWYGSVSTITGPNVSYIQDQPSLEKYIGGVDNGATGPNFPSIIGLEQSLNKASMTSVELNKVWRAEPFHNGTVFEPMVGVRYVRFIDYYKHDIYGRFDSDIFTVYPDFLTPNVLGPWEVVKTRKADFDNQMLGGQLGFRLHRKHGSWTFSGEVRTFGMQNWQFLSVYEEQTADAYNTATAADSEPRERVQTIKDSAKPVYQDSSQFVWGGEIRGNLGYDLTRDIAVNVGFTFIDYGRGIGRGGNLLGNNQDLIMTGVNFGFVYNR